MVEDKGEKSLAFEMKGNRLIVKLEDCVPSVKLGSKKYYVTEMPSVTVKGKKHFVEEIV